MPCPRIWSNASSLFVGLAVLINCSLLYYLFPSRPGNSHGKQFPLFLSYAQRSTIYPEGVGTWPYRVYKSSPLKPPLLNITNYGKEVANGSLFLVPKSLNDVWIAQETPIIMSQDNDLVFGFESPSGFNGGFNGFHPHKVNGTSFASFWYGSLVIGHGYGNIVVLDDEYRLTEITLDEPLVPNTDELHIGTLDFHEHQMTDRGTILVTAYNSTARDLSPIGGRIDGWVLDSLFFEIDVTTNECIFRWSALDHFEFTRSKLPLPCYMSDGSRRLGYDFFHINSIQAVGENFLVGSRHQWACYLISGRTGEILWGLDGSGEDARFDIPPAEVHFHWPHHMRAHNMSEAGFALSVFDNHNAAFDTGVVSSRALLFEISLFPVVKTPPVLLRNLPPPRTLFSEKQGSYVAALNNNNQLVSYGNVPIVYEYGPTGDSSDLRSEIRFGHDGGAQSYRVSKFEWKATPKAWAPSLVVEKDFNGTKIYTSWNGATEVEEWNVYSVARPEGILTRIGMATAYGFETVIEIPDQFPSITCFMVAAVQEGVEVRQSNSACLDN